jgi:hypothetical protein
VLGQQLSHHGQTITWKASKATSDSSCLTACACRYETHPKAAWLRGFTPLATRSRSRLFQTTVCVRTCILKGLDVSHAKLPEAALALRLFYVDLLAYVFTHPHYLIIDGMPVTDLLEDMQTEAKQVQYLHDLSVSAPFRATQLSRTMSHRRAASRPCNIEMTVPCATLSSLAARRHDICARH